MAAGYEIDDRAGAGAPWLVMVHGMSQDRRVFSSQREAFCDRYRILLIDLPGHGLSAGLPGPYGHLEMAAEVAGALAEAGVTRAHYWATHTGTSLGLLLAAETPDRFRSLILEGAVIPGHAMPAVDAELQHARDVARAQGVGEALRQWFERGGWFDVIRQRPEACRAAGHWAIVAAFSGANWLYDGPARPVAPIDDRIAALDLPVLLYNGARDLADFKQAAGRLEVLLPRVTRSTIPDAGGFPAWESPERVNALVADFLAAVERDGA